jgi:hexameric tyrosine-coordinated heme protein (HTHP)
MSLIRPSFAPVDDELRFEDAAAMSVSETIMDESWLPTLNTRTPQEGFELAVKLSRLAMMVSRCSDEDEGQLRRPIQRDDAPQLIQAAHLIALNFQTIAAANDWWRRPNPGRNGK